MPRQDIDINAEYGEVNTTDNLTGKVIYGFTLLARVEGAVWLLVNEPVWNEAGRWRFDIRHGRSIYPGAATF
jgi:hypothetical protein